MATLPAENEFEPTLLWRMSRAEYERMAEQGHFDDARVELLDGLVFQMSPPLPPHAGTVGLITRALWPLSDRAELRIQQPLALSPWSMPEPDVALVKSGRYVDAHPTSALLLVEVSYTSLRHDRGLKRNVYARAGIPEYWVVNVVDSVVEVFADPRDGQYAVHRTLARTESLSPTAFPDLVIAVADLLP